NLSSANLSSANLDNSILLVTNFQNTKNLIPEQFTGENPPLLCNAALPKHIIDAGIDPNRDCDQIPQVLSDRYGYGLEIAQQIVDAARRWRWRWY
ncbi:MAG: pentapeptide repeat-containing protein, partial [Cyanobacteria bacterium P01_A01_bin.17]